MNNNLDFLDLNDIKYCIDCRIRSLVIASKTADENRRENITSMIKRLRQLNRKVTELIGVEHI